MSTVRVMCDGDYDMTYVVEVTIEREVDAQQAICLYYVTQYVYTTFSRRYVIREHHVLTIALKEKVYLTFGSMVRKLNQAENLVHLKHCYILTA